MSDFENMKFPGEKGSDIHKPNDSDELQRLLSLREILPKREHLDRLTGEEMEALMLAMFRKGWHSCAYDQGLANPKDQPEFYFNSAIVELFEENHLTPPKRFKK